MGFTDYRVRVMRTATSGTAPGTTDPDTGDWVPGVSGAGVPAVILDWLPADVQEEGDNLTHMTSGESVVKADATIFIAAWRMPVVQGILRSLKSGDTVQIRTPDGLQHDTELMKARAMDGTLYVRYILLAASEGV